MPSVHADMLDKIDFAITAFELAGQATRPDLLDEPLCLDFFHTQKLACHPFNHHRFH